MLIGWLYLVCAWWLVRCLLHTLEQRHSFQIVELHDWTRRRFGISTCNVRACSHLAWLQIAADGVFCCYNNSCNGSLARRAAEMPDLKLTGRVCRFTTTFVGARHYTGKETVWCFHQLSPGAPAGWCTVSCDSLCSETSTICRLSFSCCFCCYGNDSLLACHWSAVKQALDAERFFRRV